MSTLPQRIDNRCLNCNAITHGRFCQVCGQENVEHKLGIFGLIKHFIFDLLHFDGKFFYTLKMLFIKPGFVPLQYIQGKRKTYLEPFKLFIFTSTIVVILLGLVGKSSSVNIVFKDPDNMNDSLVGMRLGDQTYKMSNKAWQKYKTASDFIKEHESKTGKKLNFVEYLFFKKQFPYFKQYDNNTVIASTIFKEYKSKIPKIFLFSIPFIVILLSLLYKKRKDLYYNEHGFFALYLYSAIYIFYFLFILVGRGIKYFNNITLNNYYSIFIFLFLTTYTFISLKKFYQAKGGITFFKLILLLIFSILILLFLLLIYSLIFLIF